MKKMVWGLVAVAALIVIGVGGYFYLEKQAKDRAMAQAEATLKIIKAEIEKATPGGEFSYGNISVNAGDRTISVAGLKMTGPGGKRAVATAAATFGGDEKVLSVVTLKDITFMERGKNVLEIKSAKLTDLALKGVLSPEKLTQIPKTDPVKILADLDLGKMVLNDVATQVEKTTDVKIAEISLAGLKDGVLSSLSLSNVNAKGKSLEVKEFGLDKLSIKNLDLKGLKELLSGAPPSNLFGITELIISNLFAVSAQTNAKVTIARVGLDGVKRDKDLITASRFFLEKAVIPLTAIKEAPPQVQAFLSGINQDAFRINAEFASSLDLKSGGLTIGPIAVSADGMGALKINGTLSDLDIPSLRKLAKGDLSGMEKLGGKIVNINLSYVDDKLADQILDAMAKGKRGKMATELSQMAASMAGQDPDVAEKVAKAVHDFLVGAKQFKISVQPAKPIPVMALPNIAMGATANKDLNLKISGN